jgi:hypothetical protein
VEQAVHRLSTRTLGMIGLVVLGGVLLAKALMPYT